MKTKNKVIAMLPARYQATRFPGKLMKDLGGKPVIVRTYEAAVQSQLFEEVYVVTDSAIIYDAIVQEGGKAIRSEGTHESGSDRIAEAIRDMDVDVIINVQGDEPFTATKPLGKLIEVFDNDVDKAVDVASLMVRLEGKEAIENPNNVKVVVNESKHAMYFSRAPIPFPRDQDVAATYYKHIGIYAFRKQALLDFTALPMSRLEKIEKLENLRFLENGMTIKMLETDHQAIGIDTEEDLIAARAQWEAKQ